MERVSKKPLISVIVPVYNVEKYLNNCIDSIINQTYKNLEIILVDDGSTDESSRICEEYKKSDSRIKVLHKKNGGLSDARNVGLKNSDGEYITFIDSDDTISIEFIEYLYNLIEKNNTSISVAPYIILTDRKKVYCDCGCKEELLEQKVALERMMLDKGFTVSACSKLFKKELFDGIQFPKGRLFEDTATIYKIFMKSQKISYGPNGGYNYYKRSNSIINSRYNRKQLDFIIFTDEMGKEVLNKYPELENAIESKKIDSRFSILRRMILEKELSSEDEKVKEELIGYIKDKRKMILKGSFNKKIKIATFLICISEHIFKMFWKAYLVVKYGI